MNNTKPLSLALVLGAALFGTLLCGCAEEPSLQTAYQTGGAAPGIYGNDTLREGDMNAPQPLPESAFFYAADTFLPIIDFGQSKYWRPDGWLLWAQWIVIALGWTLSTLFATGVRRSS